MTSLMEAATARPAAALMTLEPVTELESARRLIVRLILVIFVLLLAEGALRKWLLQPIQQAIFFIRDPFALLCMYLAWRHQLLQWTPLTLMISSMALAFAFLAGYQVLALNLSPVVAAYGWRNYFFYAGLCLVMASVMRRADVITFVRLSLWAAIPMAFLAYLQWTSPVDAPINRSIGGGLTFTVAQGVVRTNGTFTFTSGFVCFVGATFATLSAAVFLPTIRRWLVLVSCITAATCLATSGSRTAFIHAALSAAAIVGCEAFRPLAKQRPVIYLGALSMTIGLVGALWLFYPRALDLISERSSAAAQVEDPWVRTLEMVTSGFDVTEEAGFLGRGLGIGTGGGSSMNTGKRTFTLAEQEFPRVVLEAGLVFGMAYMLMRFGLVAWMIFAAIRCVRRRTDSIPLLLLPFPVVIMAVGQITMQGSVNGFGWMYTGLTLAAIASSAEDESDDG